MTWAQVYLKEAHDSFMRSLVFVSNLAVPELLLEVACVYTEYGSWKKAMETLTRLIDTFPEFRRYQIFEYILPFSIVCCSCKILISLKLLPVVNYATVVCLSASSYYLS